MITILVASLLVLLVGQVIWTRHLRRKEDALQERFLFWADRFIQAMKWTDMSNSADRAYLEMCISRERLCLAAQEAVRSDVLVYPWQWLTRWTFDYYADQERA